jgi:SSS family solute:Na+ symporter
MGTDSTQAGLNIPTLDLVIIVTYLVGIVVVGLLSVRKLRLTGDTYFLAGRSLRWPMVGAALFASNISTIHLVGLAASGYNEGLVWGNFEWMATFTLILLALVFAPFYFRARISTLPEFLERRYCPTARSFLAFMAIMGALFIHIGMSLYAGAVVFKQFFGISVAASIVIISIVTAIYTVLGGLKAVVVTETIQTVLLLVGAVVVTIFAVLALPEKANVHSVAEFVDVLRPGQMSMLQRENSAGLAWYAIFLGYPVLGIWYWCSDQTIVQRVLGAGTERDAQIGALFAGLLKILPVFVLVFPGVCAYALFKDQIGGDANQTLPVLISQLVPTGLKGLISAGLLAALMSTIAAALNSSATLVAVDIVKRIRPGTSDEAQVRIGRYAAIVVMLLAMAWSTQGGRFSSIFEAVNALAACLAPPITVCFLWGVFWRRGTKEAAVTTLTVGFALGVIAFLLDLPVMGATKLLTETWGIPFMMQAWWGFCICSAIFVITSCMTPAPAPEQVNGLTWANPLQVIFHGRISGWSDPRLLAGLLFMFMVILYTIFR